jgi:hypothetical protein
MPLSAAVALDDVAKFAAPVDLGPQVTIRRLDDRNEPWHARLLRLVPPPLTVPDPPTVLELHRQLAAVLEVLDGRRPTTALVDVLPVDVRERLLRDPWAVGTGPRVLRTVRPHRTSAYAVELCARVERAGRSRALAARLELDTDRWRFTVLTMI